MQAEAQENKNVIAQPLTASLTTQNETVALPLDVPPVVGLKGIADRIDHAFFSSDGKKIITADSGGKTAQIWDAETGQELHKLERGVFESAHPYTGYALSSDGKKIVAEARTIVRIDTGLGPRDTRTENIIFQIWDIESGKELPKLEIKSDSDLTTFETTLSFSSDGKKILTMTKILKPHSDSWSLLMFENGIVCIWDTESIKELRKIEGQFDTSNFSPDGKRVVTYTASVGDRRIWDVESGKELELLGRLNCFSPDGKKIVTTDTDITRIYDAESGRLLHMLEGHRNKTLSTNSAVFSPDVKLLVTVSVGGAHIWDVESGKELYKVEGDFPVFSPDGKKIFTTSQNKSHIWDAESGELLQMLEGHKDRIYSVRFSADGQKIVAKSGNHNIHIWKAESGKELQNIPTYVGSTPIVFSSDGKKIFEEGRPSDLYCRIWDVESGQEIEFVGERFIASSPDSKKIATTTGRTAMIWDLATLEEQIEKRRVELAVVLRQNGFTNVSDLAQFGNAELKGVAQGDNPFESARAKTRIEAAQAEIAQKVFWSEHAYTAPTAEVQVDGDHSSFLMIVPIGFVPSQLGEIVFPLPSIFIGGARYDPSGIRLTVRGSTENIEELVVSKDNYRAKVWFTNLRYENGRTSADVLKIEIVKK